MTDPNAFDKRRQSDPQGVIDDLVAQAARQAKAIHDLVEAAKSARRTIMMAVDDAVTDPGFDPATHVDAVALQAAIEGADE